MPSKHSQPSKIPDHVPGPIEQAAAQVYFDRGSKEAMDKLGWRTAAILAMGSTVVAVAIIGVMALRHEVQVFQVAKTEGGTLQVVGAAGRFTADEDTQMAWTSRWLSELTEITPAVWQRNVASVQSKVIGTASDQVRDYLQRENNNPAGLLAKKPLYIREYERRSVNKIADMTYLVRYDLVSRPAPGAGIERSSYAATITLSNVAHRTRDDVFNNPEGLAVNSFSISEENVKQN